MTESEFLHTLADLWKQELGGTAIVITDHGRPHDAKRLLLARYLEHHGYLRPAPRQGKDHTWDWPNPLDDLKSAASQLLTFASNTPEYHTIDPGYVRIPKPLLWDLLKAREDCP
jgi:hypothetical protein